MMVVTWRMNGLVFQWMGSSEGSSVEKHEHLHDEPKVNNSEAIAVDICWNGGQVSLALASISACYQM